MDGIVYITIPLSAAVTVYDADTKVKTAISLPELVRQTNFFSKKYREGCQAALLDSNPKALFLHYSVKCQKPDSDPAGHDVRVQFDVAKVEESQQAKDLDIQVSCSCPAFLYWGAQWNLHQRDGLLGPARPKLQAPTERLDLRGNYVICKHCIAPGMKVWMADGTEKNIEDVKVGDWVLTHKGRARRVIAVSRRPSKPDEEAVKVYAKGGFEPLITSNDHLFAAVRGNETCFCGCKGALSYGYRGAEWDRKYLQGHHQNRPPRKLSFDAVAEIRASTDNQYALAAAYGVSQTTVSRVQSRVKPVDDPDVEDCSRGKLRWISPDAGLTKHDYLYFPRFEWAGKEKADQNLASLLGYYLAEGSIIQGTQGKIYGVCFTLNVNERHTLAHDIENKTKALLGKDVRIVVKEQRFQNKKWLTVKVNHPGFAADMIRLGGRRSKDKHISSEAWNWDFSTMKEVLASYALGDGHFDKLGQQYVYSISRRLISQISTILFAFGVWHGHLYQDWQGEKGKVRKKNRYHRLYWDYRQYPQVLGIMRNRLRPHVLQIVNSAAPSSESSDCWRDGFTRCLNSIERVPAPSYFCDISVDEDESFIANRIVVHNCHAVFERILPSVQHNIVNILRKREVERRKDELDKTPERLHKEQERMKKKKQVEEIRKVKNKEIQQKLLDALKKEEEARMLHEEDLEEQVGPPVEVRRDEPATEEHEPAPAPEQPKPAPQSEAQEFEDIADLTKQEEEKIEQLHKENKPHIHRGLPYDKEEEEGWQGERLSSAGSR